MRVTGPWLLVAVLTTLGCKDGDTARCVANETRACTCPDGSRKAQTCVPETLTWSDCPCDAEDASTDAEDGDVQDMAVDDAGAPDTGPPPCTADAQCDDSDPCSVDACDIDHGICSNVAVDGDGDGFAAATVEGAECGGDDCDDTRDDVYPDAPEASCYDDLDSGCNGIVVPAMMVDPVTVDEGTALDWTTQVWTGSELAMVIQDFRDAWFVRVAPDGRELGSRVTLATPPSSGNVSLAWTGTRHAMAWLDSRELKVTMLDAQGTAVGTDISLGSSTVGHPRIRWTGSELGVAWPRTCGELDCVVFARMDESGTPLGTTVQLSEAGHDRLDVSDVCGLQWTGSSYGVAWKDDMSMHVRTVSADVASLGSEQVIEGVINDLRTRDCMAWSGSEFAVYWCDGFMDCWFQRVDLDGNLLGSAMDPTTAFDELEYPNVTWTGSSWMVIFLDLNPGGIGLGGSVLASDGTFEVEPTSFYMQSLSFNPPYLTSWTGSEVVMTWSTHGPRTLTFGRIGWCR